MRVLSSVSHGLISNLFAKLYAKSHRLHATDAGGIHPAIPQVRKWTSDVIELWAVWTRSPLHVNGRAMFIELAARPILRGREGTREKESEERK